MLEAIGGECAGSLTLLPHGTKPARDVLSFVDLAVFNAIIGNADAHGKNYSMLYDGTERRLAPGYDLVSTVCWSALSAMPAMKIGGSDFINSILAGHWRKFAEEIGISPAALRSRVREFCNATTKQSCETLSLPSQCNATLDTVRRRATKMLAAIA